MKRFLAMFIVLAVMLTFAPMALCAQTADQDPEGTIIVYNSTSSTEDARFSAYNNPGGGTVQTIGTHGKGVAYEESDLNGYNGVKALQLLTVGYGAWYRLTATTDTSLAGTYDIYVWNVCSGTDTRRGNSTHPDYYAQYNVVAANGETKYFIDQAHASGGKDGWVKLGTHYFSGSESERVVVSKNYQNNSSTYLSAVKFVPVKKLTSTKLTHMYMKYYDNSNIAKKTRIELEDTPITANTFVKQFPATYDDGMDYASSTGRIELTFETEDPDATVKFSWGGEGTGKTSTSIKANSKGTNYYDLTVTSADGTATEEYHVSLGVDSSAGTKYFAVKSTEYANAYSSGGSYDDTANERWSYPTELGTAKSNMNVLGDANTWTFGSDTLAAGSYSVYVWSTAQDEMMDEAADVIVNHGGIRSTKSVNVGNYHKNNAQWAYVGSYYFDGTAGEAVTVMKTSTTERLAISGIKLSPCLTSKRSADFEGITVTTAQESVGITKALLENGTYVQPLEAGDYTTASINVVGNHPNLEYVKINGEAASINEGKKISVNAVGETSVAAEVKLTGETAKTYKLTLFKESATSHTQRVQGNVQTFVPALSVDYERSDAKYITAAGSVAGFPIKDPNADKITDGYYKLLAWKPAFGYHINSTDTSTKLYASDKQSVKINTGYKTAATTVDWTGTECGWVDLGNYNLSHDGIDAIDNDYGVEFIGMTDAYTMLNEVKYLKLADGMLVDDEFISLKELDDKVIYTGAAQINVTPFIDGATVYVNNSLVTAEPTSIPVNDTLNRLKVRVEKDDNAREYNLSVVKSATIMNYDDLNVDGADGSEADCTGYNRSAVLVFTDAEAVYNVHGTATGTTKVWMYQIPVNEVDVDGYGTQFSVTVTTGGTFAPKEFEGPSAEGWVLIGEYAFGDNDTETITVTIDGDNVMYLNCIKLEGQLDSLYITDPAIEISDLEATTAANGNVGAWVYAYNKTGSSKKVSVVLAVYDGETGALKHPVSIKTEAVNDGVIKIAPADIAVEEGENVFIKAFVLDGSGTLTPLKNAVKITAATSQD